MRNFKNLLLVACILIACSLSLIATRVSAAYAMVNSAKPICFAEEVSNDHEMIVFQYTRKAMAASSEHKVRLTAFSPISRKQFQDRILTKHSEVLTFSTYRPPASMGGEYPIELGEYEICLSLADESSFFSSGIKEKGILVEVLVDHRDRRKPISSATESQAAALRTRVKNGDEVFTFTDEDGTVKEALRTHDFLDRVTHQLQKIDSVIDEVVDEARYFTNRQARMRTTSESSFTRVWGFSVLSICMLVGVSLIQYFSLRSFLMGKKLI